MARYKVLKDFRLLDKPSIKGKGTILRVGEEIELTVKRATEVEKNLDGSFLKRIEEDK